MNKLVLVFILKDIVHVPLSPYLSKSKASDVYISKRSLQSLFCHIPKMMDLNQFAFPIGENILPFAFDNQLNCMDGYDGY